MSGYQPPPVNTDLVPKGRVSGAWAQWFIGLSKRASASVEVTWESLKGKPSAFPPSKHSHTLAEVSGIQDNRRKTVTIALEGPTGTVKIAKVFEILSETASAPGRFRLYRTTEGRDADLARPVLIREPNNAGLLLEDVFGDPIREIPAPCASGPDGLCAWSWSGPAGATLELEILVMED